MRVIGGTFGGRRLRPVEGLATRPTSDRVREALFSRLEARYDLAGAVVLDLFAGTGALSIEALSRGAARAVCIEIDRRALDTLKGNVREFDLADKVRVMNDDYRRVLARLAGDQAGATPLEGAAPRTTKKRFDGIFVDPPYGQGLAQGALAAVAEFGLLKVGGWMTMEVGRREDTPAQVVGPFGVLDRIREDVYGDTKLALYEASEPSTNNDCAGDEESPALEANR